MAQVAQIASRKVVGSIPDDVMEFFIEIIFRPHYGRELYSASNRNEHRGYFPRGKGSLCVGLITLPPSCADCHEILGASISCNLLDLKDACTGTASAMYVLMYSFII